jgi:hypothetical protein
MDTGSISNIVRTYGNDLCDCFYVHDVEGRGQGTKGEAACAQEIRNLAGLTLELLSHSHLTLQLFRNNAHERTTVCFCSHRLDIGGYAEVSLSVCNNMQQLRKTGHSQNRRANK